MVAYNRAYQTRTLVGGELMKPDQKYPRGQFSKPKHQFAEILVGRHQHRAPGVRLGQHLVVRNARRQLGDLDNIVPVRPKLFHD
jgi:hypothetical protein